MTKVWEIPELGMYAVIFCLKNQYVWGFRKWHPCPSHTPVKCSRFFFFFWKFQKLSNFFKTYVLDAWLIKNNQTVFFWLPFQLKSHRTQSGQRPESPIILIRYLKVNLFKKEQRSTTENNCAKIWINQMLRTFWIPTATLSIRRDSI